jgi:hypothetical protein
MDTCRGFPVCTRRRRPDELNVNLRDVVAMLLEDGETVLEAEFVGIQTVPEG